MINKEFKHSGTLNVAVSEREIINGKLAEKIATESIVLLKNENILPLKIGSSIALLGCGADKTVKGGIGSGEVNNRNNVSIYKGLSDAGLNIVSKDWIEDYEKRYKKAREEWKDRVLGAVSDFDNPFDAYATNPFAFPEGRKVNEEDLKGAEAAIYVISRLAGEGKDRKREAGDYYLSKSEKEDLLFISKQNIPVILIVNAGGPVELTEILKKAENIKAVLNISQLGQEGGNAVANIVTGKVSPSGKLTTTWAEKYEDYPLAEEFGYLSGNLKKTEYREGIYVGYRYFDAFNIKPLFSFGFGLSYTDFSINFVKTEIKENGVEVCAKVKNTGDKFSGKETVQIYVTLPKGKEAKEYRRLAGFAKTSTLKPGQEEEVKIFIHNKNFASFSEKNRVWEIEKGQYGLQIGSSIAALSLCTILNVKENIVYEKVKAFKDLKTDIQELHNERYEDYSNVEGVPVMDFAPEALKEINYTAPKATEQSLEELIPVLYGNITENTSMLGSSGIRVPGSAGETTETLEEKYNISSLIMADGPAGVRLRQSYDVDRESDAVYGAGVFGAMENGILEPAVEHENADTYYQYCTAFPVGTAIAQTWNKELLQEMGKAVEEEMLEFHVDIWLAPGMNIHRNPLCGRNYEYYSEDPLLSGMVAAAVTKGVQHSGKCAATIKHFACNNQEDNRMGVNVIASERTLREIYLKGFEIAVKESSPMAIMTSYNLINGVHAANSFDLCTKLAREEWGFEGLIMTDWNTTYLGGGSIPWKCIDAGNDLIMPGNTFDKENIIEALEKGELSEEKVRECAGRVINLAKKLKEQ